MKWLGGLIGSSPSSNTTSAYPSAQEANSGASQQQQAQQGNYQTFTPTHGGTYQIGVPINWQYHHPYNFTKENIAYLFDNEDFRKELKKFIFNEEMKKLTNEE